MTLPLPDLDPVLELKRPLHEFYLAVVHEGVVYQVLNCEGQAAALYMSNPTFVQVANGATTVGQLYDASTGTFSNAE
jgi:hypothetical protein